MKFIGKSVLLEEGKERVVVIGDLHLGYEHTIHHAGIGVSFLKETCAELDALFAEIRSVRTCVLLGDVLHRFTQVGNEEWKGVRAVFSVIGKYVDELIVVRGNHDVSLTPLLTEFHLSLVDSWTWNGYCCAHGDRDLPALHVKGVHTWILGHGHPAYRLREGAKQELYKCFLRGRFHQKEIVLVPSFFQGVIGTDVSRYALPYPWEFPLETFTFYLVSEQGEVMNFGTLLAH